MEGSVVYLWLTVQRSWDSFLVLVEGLFTNSDKHMAVLQCLLLSCLVVYLPLLSPFQFYQRNGFKCPVSKKDKITVEILSPQGPIPHSLEFSPEPQNNEVTVHAFTVKRAGIYSISVTVMHVHIKGSPFKKKFLAGESILPQL